MMNDKLDWTKSLGDAVLARQPDVMDAIQHLRAKAQANNKPMSTKEQKVTVQKVEKAGHRSRAAIAATDAVATTIAGVRRHGHAVAATTAAAIASARAMTRTPIGRSGSKPSRGPFPENM